jgi:hypothetical protein
VGRGLRVFAAEAIESDLERRVNARLQDVVDALRSQLKAVDVAPDAVPTAPERPSAKAVRELTELTQAMGGYDKEMPVKDNVNHPDHYTQGGIETIDAIEAALGPAGFRAYCKGNALKYIWREEHKGQDESLRKAIWYLNRLVTK